MVDTLAPRGIVGVMTPAMNTVVQPELELLRPEGVSNQMQRFRLGGDNVSEDIVGEAEKLMDCKPVAICIGLTTDAGAGGVEKLAARCRDVASASGVPVCNASEANHAALRALGATRVAVVTPFNAQVDEVVRENVEKAGYEVVFIKGTEAPSLPEICETPLDKIRDVFRRAGAQDCDAVLQVGTALPVVAMIDALEGELGKPIVACNAAAYWQTLRAAGIETPIHGFGRLLAEH